MSGAVDPPPQDAEAHHHDLQLRKPGLREVVQSVVGLSVATALLAFGLPYVTDTTWAQIAGQLTLVGFENAALMALLMMAGLYCYTFTLTGSLPGLGNVRALMVNAAGSMVSNLLPGGGAVGVALTYVMYRSWGFTRRAISTSVIVTSVWNIMSRLALPVVAVFAVLINGVDAPRPIIVGSLVAAGVGTALIILFALLIYSDWVSGLVGQSLAWLAGLFSSRARRPGAVSQLIQDQRTRMSHVVERRGLSMTLGLVGMFGFFFLLYLAAARTLGLELPVAHLFAAFAFRQLLTVVAITPGGLGITEVGTAGVLVAFGADPAAASATALLYAVFTHLLVVPLGFLAWAGWMLGLRRTLTDEPGHATGDDA